MAAGTKYNLTSEKENEELYRIDTGVRKTGPWKLDTSNLVAGYQIPHFAPIEADLKTHVLKLVRNVKVVEAYATGASSLSIKIAKNSLAYKGMFIGSGTKGAEVTGIDTSNSSYDVLTIKAAFGEDVEADAILFESVSADGLKKKNTANFVVFDRFKKVDMDGTLLTPLMQAYEVKESKLTLPIHSLDKIGLTSRFQFDA